MKFAFTIRVKISFTLLFGFAEIANTEIEIYLASEVTEYSTHTMWCVENAMQFDTMERSIKWDTQFIQTTAILCEITNVIKLKPRI